MLIAITTFITISGIFIVSKIYYNMKNYLHEEIVVTEYIDLWDSD